MTSADCIRRHRGGISYIGRDGVMKNEGGMKVKECAGQGDPDTDPNVSHSVLQDV